MWIRNATNQPMLGQWASVDHQNYSLLRHPHHQISNYYSPLLSLSPLASILLSPVPYCPQNERIKGGKEERRGGRGASRVDADGVHNVVAKLGKGNEEKEIRMIVEDEGGGTANIHYKSRATEKTYQV